MSARDLLLELLDRADARSLEQLYAAVSVSTRRVRAQLRRAGRPFLDPARPAPALSSLDSTARYLILQASGSATLLSGLTGVGGAATVPTEIVASTLAVLRLAQRLAVAYGHDPETDRGQLTLWTALAAGYELELPAHGPVGLRLSELPQLLHPPKDVAAVGASLTHAIVRRSAWMVARRVTRFVPVLSAGVAAIDARRRTRQIGARMAASFRDQAALGPEPQIEDALEL